MLQLVDLHNKIANDYSFVEFCIIYQLENPDILNISMSRIRALDSSSDLCKDEDDVTSFTALIQTIKTTVVTYVSQIALVEQKRLVITGELTLSIFANGTEPEDDDFEECELSLDHIYFMN